jgi:hypothetical protein
MIYFKNTSNHKHKRGDGGPGAGRGLGSATTNRVTAASTPRSSSRSAASTSRCPRAVVSNAEIDSPVAALDGDGRAATLDRRDLQLRRARRGDVHDRRRTINEGNERPVCSSRLVRRRPLFRNRGAAELVARGLGALRVGVLFLVHRGTRLLSSTHLAHLLAAACRGLLLACCLLHPGSVSKELAKPSGTRTATRQVPCF